MRRHWSEPVRAALIGGVAVLAACASGCASYSSPVIPPPGMLFSHIRAPLMLNKPTEEISPDDKRGESQTHYVWIPPFRQVTLAWAEAAVREAAHEGGVRRVKHVDYDYMGVLLVYGRYKVIVYGE